MKRFVCAMCAMTLLLFGAMPTALAAAAPSPSAQTAESEDSTPAPSTEDLPTLPIPEPDPVPLYPAEVKQSEENGITRIEKIYYLSSQDDPANIPTEDFEREGLARTLKVLCGNVSRVILGGKIINLPNAGNPVFLATLHFGGIGRYRVRLRSGQVGQIVRHGSR